MSLAGVVLAGGRSARMGSPKALLDFRGQPFVVRILEALEALEVKTRVVVVGPDAPRIRPALAGHECLIVENTDVDGGPIASLRAALRALQPVRPSAALVWPVDLPHVRVTTVERLLETYRRVGGEGGAPAIVPTFAERRGHPVLWGAALFAELLTSDAATQHGARAVLHAHGAEIAPLAVDDPAVIDDLNTPEDYERLVREINRDAY
jgi:CTP:molybdopterin cytidylyltransferase MocA